MVDRRITDAIRIDNFVIRKDRCNAQVRFIRRWNAFRGIPLSVPTFVGLAVLLSLVASQGFGFCASFVLPSKPIRHNSLDSSVKNFPLGPTFLSTLTTDTQMAPTRNDFDTINSDFRESRVIFNNKQNERIPFIVERVAIRPPLKLYKEIAQMCINAFFNTDNSKTYKTMAQKSAADNTPFYKEWQLNYLRTLQAGDLERRRRREPIKNTMFIARRVIPLSSFSMEVMRQPLLRQSPLVLDTNRIQNRPFNDEEYVYGELIGFVEVTQRTYALGEEGRKTVERSVLTNLSVSRSARQSGVGSALVDACERVASLEYCGQRGDALVGSKIATVVPEIVLEVEEDNANAIEFYRKRGYVDVFTDPTSRRYDTSGLWLQQVRCKRLVMKKDLRRPFLMPSNNVAVANVENTVNMGLQAFQRFRNNLLNVS